MCNSCKPTVTFEPKTTTTKPTTAHRRNIAKPTTPHRSIAKKRVIRLHHHLKGQPLHYVNSPEQRLTAAKRRLAAKLKNDGENDCCICLESLTGGKEHIYVTECGHKYHRECLQECAKSGSTSCALCRTPLVVPGVKPPDAWYVKHLGQPGYRWLDKWHREKDISRKFDEILEVIALVSHIEQ